MGMIVKTKKLSQMSVLLLVAFSFIVLSGCGKPGTPPPGAAVTIATKGGALHSAPKSTTDITVQFYRVTVTDADGIPLQGVNVDILGSFTAGDNITLNNDAFGPTSPQALVTSVKTGDFGFYDFPISAPTFSFGTLSPPVATGATALASGGTVTVGTFNYAVTATDAATPPVETTISNIVTATTTTSVSSITIKWQAVSRASGYFVYGDGGLGGGLFKLTVTSQSASSVCNSLTLICSFTDTTGLTGASPPPSSNLSGQGLNSVTGTLTATTGPLLTTLDIAQ